MRLFKRLILMTSLLLTCWSAIGSDMKVQAPDFTLKSASGENLRLSEQRGKVILLNFWASWCGPCRQEMPILNRLHNQYADLGFMVIGLNVDMKTDKAMDYLKQTPVDFPVLFDPDSQVSELYRVSAMPSTALIDRDGQVRFIHAGYKAGDEAEYEATLKKLLRE